MGESQIDEVKKFLGDRLIEVRVLAPKDEHAYYSFDTRVTETLALRYLNVLNGLQKYLNIPEPSTESLAKYQQQIDAFEEKKKRRGRTTIESEA